MRLKIEFSPEIGKKEIYSLTIIDKHHIQSFLWSLLKDTEYDSYHNLKGYKFFSFSDIFPINDIRFGEKFNLLISSPNKFFIKELYYRLKELNSFNLSNITFDIINVKKFSVSLSNRFITGSPIVVRNVNGSYYSPDKDGKLGFDYFIKKLTETSIIKYSLFNNKKLDLNGPLFDYAKYRRSVVIPMSIRENKFNILGSNWVFEKKFIKNEEERRFYKFILDCGLGEKTSLGFGFINPI